MEDDSSDKSPQRKITITIETAFGHKPIILIANHLAKVRQLRQALLRDYGINAFRHDLLLREDQFQMRRLQDHDVLSLYIKTDKATIYVFPLLKSGSRDGQGKGMKVFVDDDAVQRHITRLLKESGKSRQPNMEYRLLQTDDQKPGDFTIAEFRKQDTEPLEEQLYDQPMPPRDLTAAEIEQNAKTKSAMALLYQRLRSKISKASLSDNLGAMDASDFNLSSFIGQLLQQRKLTVDEAIFESWCRRAFIGVNEASHLSPGQLFRSWLDLNRDGKLDTEEEQDRLRKWLGSFIPKRKSALIVVDMQNDFITGSLSIKNGPARQDPEAIIDPINHLIKSIPFDLVVYTHDWHPPNHISFFERIYSRPVASNANKNGGWKVGDTVPFLVNGRVSKQSVWPTHCVENTQGAQLHPRLQLIDDEKRMLRIFKGQNPDVEHYSAFFDNERTDETILRRELNEREVTDVYICGFSYDLSVPRTAKDALDLAYRTAVIDDCTFGFNLKGIEDVRKEIMNGYGTIVQSTDVSGLVSGKRMPWSWAYARAIRQFQK